MFQHVHLLDIFLFYAIPSLLRITLDFLVLIHCYSPFSVEGLDRVTIDRRYAISGPATTKRFSHTGETDTLDNKAHVALAISITASTNTPVSKSQQICIQSKTQLFFGTCVVSKNYPIRFQIHFFKKW